MKSTRTLVACLLALALLLGACAAPNTAQRGAATWDASRWDGADWR